MWICCACSRHSVRLVTHLLRNCLFQLNLLSVEMCVGRCWQLFFRLRGGLANVNRGGYFKVSGLPHVGKLEVDDTLEPRKGVFDLDVKVSQRSALTYLGHVSAFFGLVIQTS